MRYVICGAGGHTLVCGELTLYPETVSFVRKDSFYELEKTGGGTALRTNGPIGMDIIVTGRFSPDERTVLQSFITEYATGDEDIVIDQVNYGELILREATLSDENGAVTGKYRIRLGGYEL